MMKYPLATIVICGYNAGVYLRQSVRSALEQTYPHIEVLVMDDGSTDGSTAWLDDLEDSRVRMIRQPNAGKPSALNRALREMKGEFFAIQDADDLSHPERIEAQVACLLAEPELAACFVGNELVIDNQRMAPLFRAKSPRECREDVDKMRLPAHDPTGVFRRSLIGSMQFDEELPIGQGTDFIFRVGEQFPMRVLGRCLYSYRIHADSVTRADPDRRIRYAMLLRRKTLRRRAIPVPEATDHIRARRKNGNRRRDNHVSHFMDSVVCLRRAGRWGEAVRTGWACASLHRLDPEYYRPLLYGVCPLAIIDWWRSRHSSSKTPPPHCVPKA